MLFVVPLVAEIEFIDALFSFALLCFAYRFDFHSLLVVAAASITFYTYPAIPDDSILFANSTSFEYTSYCLQS